jgi:hypothetical protein
MRVTRVPNGISLMLVDEAFASKRLPGNIKAKGDRKPKVKNKKTEELSNVPDQLFSYVHADCIRALMQCHTS